MNKSLLYVAASLLSLAGLGLIVWGLPDRSLVWQIGLGLVVLAMLLSLASRWLGTEEEAQ